MARVTTRARSVRPRAPSVGSDATAAVGSGVERRVLARVALGGALGTALRLVVLLPLAAALTGTSALRLLTVNLVGTALLAVLAVRADASSVWAERVPLLGVGLLGGLTTFSSLAVGLAVLVADGRPAAALGLAAASLVGGCGVALVAGRAARGAPPSGPRRARRTGAA